MTLLAAAMDAQIAIVDRIHAIPMGFWFRLGVGVVALIAAVLLVRKVAQVNKVLLTMGLIVAGTIVGFNWIYERNEPEWARPTVQWLAGFFPSKGRV